MSPSIDSRRWIFLPDGSRMRNVDLDTAELRIEAESEADVEPEMEGTLGAAHPPAMLEIDATEAAIALAEEEDVDLSTVTGTGKNGKITKWDVIEALEPTQEQESDV